MHFNKYKNHSKIFLLNVDGCPAYTIQAFYSIYKKPEFILDL
jgi:hypothetical protein